MESIFNNRMVLIDDEEEVRSSTTEKKTDGRKVVSRPELNAILTARQELSPRQIIIRIAAEGWDLPEFEPGQFAVLGLTGSASRYVLSEPERTPSPANKMIRRAYSIASSSLINEYMEFYISLVSDGALTPRIFNLGIGDKIFLSHRITGMFTLEDVPANKNIVMIATGTGLAPYMSMLTTELVCGGPRKIAVLHGAYHSWDLGYRSELMNMQHLCRNLNYFATIDKPDDEPIPWRGPIGFVQHMWHAGLVDQVWGFHPSPKDTHVFLCGNPAMIDDMEAILAAEGFSEHTRQQPGEIHIERY